MTYHSEDITFCISQCSRTSCYRHKSNIQDPDREHIVADLKGTVYCQLPPERPAPIRKRGRKRRT